VKVPVSWHLLLGILLTSLLTNFALITPDMLTFLGRWAPFTYGVVFAALGYLTAIFGVKSATSARNGAAPDPDMTTTDPVGPAPAPQAPPPVEPTI
jgi:hypothetical protein